MAVAVINLYLDDSGTRNPDRSPAQVSGHGHDWFGIGGVMLREEDEDSWRAAHAALCAKWPISAPLHSSEIRSKKDSFRWLRGLSAEQYAELMADLTALATRPELTAIACVIDRPGYNQRYLAKYGQDRWELCKTAFSIVVERSAKYARALGRRLRVNIERADKKTDRLIRGYYDELRGAGHPFDAAHAAKYAPLTSAELAAVLYEFRTKDKTSPPIQIADICLWPMCFGGYRPDNLAYRALQDAGTLIDTKLPPDEVESRGIKYSCWELQTARAAPSMAPEKPEPGEAPGSGQPPLGDLVG